MKHGIWTLSCFLLAVAIGSCDRYGVAPPPLTLTAYSGEPAGANCLLGGTRVDMGVDANRDSLLEPNEIRSTTFICTRPPDYVEPETLVNTFDLPDGEICGFGGMKLEIGSDLNSSGSLEPNEVQRVVVDCNRTLSERQKDWQFLSDRPLITDSEEGVLSRSDYFVTGFDVRDYTQYDAALLRAYFATSDASATVTAELYNLTDQTVVHGSELTTTGTAGNWSDSFNVFGNLPHKPIDFALRVRTSIPGVKVTVYQAYLIIYKI